MSFTLGNVLLFFVEYEPADSKENRGIAPDLEPGYTVIEQETKRNEANRERSERTTNEMSNEQEANGGAINGFQK